MKLTAKDIITELTDDYVQKFILFDDVVTTGASMAACVPLLQSAGARAIFLLCLARDKK